MKESAIGDACGAIGSAAGDGNELEQLLTRTVKIFKHAVLHNFLIA
jgi:hypothetical protein